VTGPDAGGSPVELRRRMVDAVLAHDFVTGWRAGVVPWRPALLAVPRHEFLPDTVWVENGDGASPALVPLRREQDPDRWLRLAYAADDGVATQVDDGSPSGPHGGGSLPSSSASAPVIVTVMLAALDAQEGHRVLEVGTGTGHNAALLAHRLGAGQVTSIEIDSDIATHARKALSDAGFGAVRVVTGDGALGYPRAPRMTGWSSPRPVTRFLMRGWSRSGRVGGLWCRGRIPTPVGWWC
jgi:protein-L-isoaspartate O-methyltransferase